MSLATSHDQAAETAREGASRRRVGRRLFWILVAVVLLMPLPFGAVHPVPWSLAAAVIGCLLLAWALCVLFRDLPYRPGMARLRHATVPFGLVLLWAGLQSLGGDWVPAALRHPLWDQAGAALGVSIGGAISIDPWASLTGIVRLASYAAVFWLAFHLVRSDRQARRFMQVFVTAAALYAAYGLIVHLNGLELVLWHRKTAYLESLTSTFINRNSYATYAGLGVVAATALLIQGLLDRLALPLGRRETGLRLLGLVSGRGGWLLVAWCLLVSALLLTQSRAGIASTLVALLALFLAYGWSGALARRHLAIAVGLILAVGLAFFLVSGGGFLDRFGSRIIEREVRPEIYDAVLQLIAYRPWLGSGLGSFEQAFRLVQGESLTQAVAMAHSSYLEAAVELGVPAAALLTLAVLAPAGACLMALRQHGDTMLCPAVAVAATLLVGLHATIDFSLQIPAVAATYALLLGLGAGISFAPRAA